LNGYISTQPYSIKKKLRRKSPRMLPNDMIALKPMLNSPSEKEPILSNQPLSGHIIQIIQAMQDGLVPHALLTPSISANMPNHATLT